MFELGEMDLFLSSTSEQIDKTFTKIFLGIAILPQRTRKIDEERFSSTFLIFYVIYQTESMTLHACVD